MLSIIYLKKYAQFVDARLLGEKSGKIAGMLYVIALNDVVELKVFLFLMNKKNKNLSPELTNRIIRLAWEDRASFESIEKELGLAESDVIYVMRSQLKPSSFKRWRARVSGRITKHRKLLKQSLS